MHGEKQEIHQRGDVIMQQGVLPFQYEIEGSPSGMTALAGLPAFLDLTAVSGLRESIGRHVQVRGGSRGQGWTDAQQVMALVLMNLAGGDCVDDLRTLSKDEGFCRVLMRTELAGLPRRERRETERRWRREKRRAVPSPSAVFRYLGEFHDPEQERARHAEGAPEAFIPAPNEALQGLALVNRDLLAFDAAQGVDETATLDLDATLIYTEKETAQYCYKHRPAYQPLNVYWAEQQTMLHTEFRDGNVPAGHQQLRVFQEALRYLPSQVKRVRTRSDTAGYQHEFLRYCEQGEDPRFGRIEFAVSCDVTPAFKQAVSEVPEGEWRPMHRMVGGQRVKTGVEWAEVCFVPNAIGHSKKGPEYRYLAIREVLAEQEIPGIAPQRELPFPSMTLGGRCYKLFGIVTNMDWEGERLIAWQHERCGKSEEAHAVLKNDLAGGHVPSHLFGANAAWWRIVVLAFNLLSIMKRRVLGHGWVEKRLKAIRYSLIHLSGRVLERARRLIVRLAESPMSEMLLEVRRRILCLVRVSTA